MAKSKYFELIFVFLVIFFQQFAIAQTPDKPVTTNTAISAKQNSTSKSEVAAEAELAATEARLGLPAADPMRAGTRFERMLDACAA